MILCEEGEVSVSDAAETNIKGGLIVEIFKVAYPIEVSAYLPELMT